MDRTRFEERRVGRGGVGGRWDIGDIGDKSFDFFEGEGRLRRRKILYRSRFGS